MDTLFGSAPKASFDTQPTVDPTQKTTLDALIASLGGTAQNAVWPTSPGLTPQQFGVINPLVATAPTVSTAPTAQQTGAIDSSFNTLSKLLNYSYTPEKVGMIDSSDVFQRSVIDPLEKTFNERTLPGIAGKYGLGAGGAVSSDAAQARRQAGADLTATEANYGAQFAYDTAKANQVAQGTNQTAGLTAATLGATTQGAALKAAPGTLVTPSLPAASGVDLLNALLPGVNQTYTTQKDQSTYGLDLLKALLAASSGTTQTTTGVGTGGSTGLVSGLLSGTGSALGGGGLASLIALSDRRAKADLEQVGEVDGFPLYKFRYKDDPRDVRRLGLLAQDVERRKPSAVGRVPGTDLRTVNYSKLITDLLAA
jgi:hypothetical protein